MIGSGRRRGGRRAAALVLAGALVVVSACTGGDSTADEDRADLSSGPDLTYPTVPFSQIDDQLGARVANDGLGGAVLLVSQDGADLHRTELGELTSDSVVPVGEVGRWLTAVLAMVLVEQGRLDLDEPVGGQEPAMADVVGAERAAVVTPRQLLSHTSGLPVTVDCEVPDPDGGAEPVVDCDRAVATSSSIGAPGESFHVSAAGFHALARLVEEVGDEALADQVRSGLTDRLGMPSTTMTADPADPLLGSDAETTANDLARFLDVVLARGALGDGGRLVDEDAFSTMEHDETARLGTNGEPWVAWTGIPTFGLGVWRDRLRGDGTAAMVSAAGRFGAYPWVDRFRNAHGVLLVVDDTDPAEAVGASAALTQQMGAAIDTDGRPLRVPGSPIPQGPD